MLGARASTKRAKVGVNSKPQMLAQASDADGSGDADGTASIHDVTPSSSPAAASTPAAANSPPEATAAAAVLPIRSDGGSASGGGGGAVRGGHPGSDSDGTSSTAQADPLSMACCGVAEGRTAPQISRRRLSQAP